jgi:hypothetical protein
MSLSSSLRWTALSAALSMIATLAHADERVNPQAEIEPLRLPGVGAHDPRLRIDPNAAPWRAVGKLQASAGQLLYVVHRHIGRREHRPDGGALPL